MPAPTKTCFQQRYLVLVTLILVSGALFVFNKQHKRIALGSSHRLEQPNYNPSEDSIHFTQNHVRKWRIPPLERVHLSLENTHHLAFDSPIGDLEWNATLPSGGAVIHLGPDRQTYTVGIFHRLRCLNIIRKNLAEFYADDSPSAQIPQPTLVRHCMNYLRQMVLCDSDLTLESIRSDRGNHLTTWDVTHECMDWSVVYGEAEKNWASHSRRKEV